MERNGLTAKTRKFVVASGFGPDHNLGVYNNNVDTIERAFVERYFLCKDGEGFRPAFKVGPSSFRGSLITFQDEVLRHMPRLPVLSRQQVVDAYRGSKYRVYVAADRSLSELPLHKGDAQLTSFVKFEKQDVSKAPRVINPRSPRYNLMLGKYLKHAEHHYFSAINKAFGCRTPATVIKGMNADRSADVLRMKWDLFDKPVAIGLDATKFDMHVSVAALKYEHKFYTRLFPRSNELAQMLKWQLVNSGTAYAGDGRVKFKMQGTRSSGDLNTSLGNCLLMCGMIWALLNELDITAELANNGDDCVLIMEESDERRFRESVDHWFRNLGFAMAVEPSVYEFEEIEFCQTHPVELTSGWRMVRNYASVCLKDPMCLLAVPNSNVYRKWLGAVGECGGNLSAGVPVLSAMYRVFSRNGVQASEQFVNEVYKNRSQLSASKGLRCNDRISDQARVSFYYAFGVLPDIQKELETYYDAYIMDIEVHEAIERSALVLNPGFNIISNVQ